MKAAVVSLLILVFARAATAADATQIGEQSLYSGVIPDSVKSKSFPTQEFKHMEEREWTGLACQADQLSKAMQRAYKTTKPRKTPATPAMKEQYWAELKKAFANKTFKGKLNAVSRYWVFVLTPDGEYQMPAYSLDQASLDYVTRKIAKAEEQRRQRKAEEEKKRSKHLKQQYDHQ